MVRETIAIQGWLRPALTPVKMNCDYDRFKEHLDKIDHDIRSSSLESLAVDFALEEVKRPVSEKKKRRLAQFAIVALRMELLRHLLGVPSFRAYSRMLSSSDLLAEFCGVRTLEGIQWTSKSTLERASKLFSEEQLARMNQLLTEVSANGDLCDQVGLSKPVDAGVCLVDSTCLEANIHYPVDWVLLGDVSLTLIKAIKLIRKRGLLNRMEHGPEELAGQMNRLCIEMTHSRRKADAVKIRKGILRRMKQLLKRTGAHALKHRDLLEQQWCATPLSAAQARKIIDRIDEKLALIPKVIKQAHERLIGGRQVKSSEKILSAHEKQIHVLVRGKAGKEVEYGNNLFLCESGEGFILDYHLYREGPVSDIDQLCDSLERQNHWDIEKPISCVVGDRGFDSKTIVGILEQYKIENAICPRDVEKLRVKITDAEFVKLQKRRGSTEARIAIFKNHGNGRVCRAKGFAHRAQAVGLGVLAHNLWWIAREVLEEKRKRSKAA